LSSVFSARWVIRFRAVSQGTNSDSNLGYGVQRPKRIGNPNSLAPVFTIGNSSRNPVRGPGLQDVD
jgi:hypothetical protein